MMTCAEMFEARIALIAYARAIHERALSEARDFTDDERFRYEDAMSNARRLSEQMATLDEFVKVAEHYQDSVRNALRQSATSVRSTVKTTCTKPARWSNARPPRPKTGSAAAKAAERDHGAFVQEPQRMWATEAAVSGVNLPSDVLSAALAWNEPDDDFMLGDIGPKLGAHPKCRRIAFAHS